MRQRPYNSKWRQRQCNAWQVEAEAVQLQVKRYKTEAEAEAASRQTQHSSSCIGSHRVLRVKSTHSSWISKFVGSLGSVSISTCATAQSRSYMKLRANSTELWWWCGGVVVAAAEQEVART